MNFTLNNLREAISNQYNKDILLEFINSTNRSVKLLGNDITLPLLFTGKIKTNIKSFNRLRSKEEVGDFILEFKDGIFLNHDIVKDITTYAIETMDKDYGDEIRYGIVPQFYGGFEYINKETIGLKWYDLE